MIPVPNFEELRDGAEKKIAEAAAQTVPDMLRAVGMDPAHDLRGEDWSNTKSWGDEDVTGWNFQHADLTGANLSTLRNLDKALFAKRTILDGAILPDGITAEMLLSNAAH